jgi:hypothetical protein
MRPGAPKAGQKRKRYLRWKRFASLATGIALLGFAALFVNFLLGQGETGESEATRALLDDLSGALGAYHARTGTLPERIAQLVGPNSPYQGDPIPEDAWRRRIEFRVVDARAGEWRLRSLGADGQPGTSDDLVLPAGTSW